jgi:hypothetical protein
MRIFTVAATALVLAGAPNTELGTKSFALAQGAHGPTGAPPADATTQEEKMRRRLPQPVRVGALIGARVLDEGDVTLGRVREVVRSADGKIRLIVAYGGWFGWGARSVAIPVETVALIGKNIAAVDISPKEISNLPVWSDAASQPIGPDEIIRLAISRR